jgi:hypothetical protein
LNITITGAAISFAKVILLPNYTSVSSVPHKESGFQWLEEAFITCWSWHVSQKNVSTRRLLVPLHYSSSDLPSFLEVIEVSVSNNLRLFVLFLVDTRRGGSLPSRGSSSFSTKKIKTSRQMKMQTKMQNVKEKNYHEYINENMN